MPLSEMSLGNGTLQCSLTCVCDLHGSMIRQFSKACGESTTKQESDTMRPVSRPPPNSTPLPKRVSKLTPKKSDERVCFPNTVSRLTTFVT